MAVTNLDFNDKAKIMHMITQASNFILKKINKKPDVVIVLGSGLGTLVETIKNPIIIPYEDIPFFPKPTVEGHGGQLFIGEISGKIIMAMLGRMHFYEGYDTQTLTFPIRVFAKMGIKNLILTNACGGINKHFKSGDLMIIEDHISFLCPSPLRGIYLDEFGPRFTDMSKAYTKELIDIAENCALNLNINIKKGIYAFWMGPTYETGAEIKAFMALGADAVGMSTVPETIVACNAGMKVLGISCITNMACIYNQGEISHKEVIEMGLIISEKFINLVTNIIKEI